MLISFMLMKKSVSILGFNKILTNNETDVIEQIV